MQVSAKHRRSCCGKECRCARESFCHVATHLSQYVHCVTAPAQSSGVVDQGVVVDRKTWKHRRILGSAVLLAPLKDVIVVSTVEELVGIPVAHGVIPIRINSVPHAVNEWLQILLVQCDAKHVHERRRRTGANVDLNAVHIVRLHELVHGI